MSQIEFIMVPLLTCWILFFVHKSFAFQSLTWTDISPIGHDCRLKWHELTEAAKSFTHCAFSRAIDADICFNCTDHWIDFHNQYNHLKTNKQEEDCRNVLLSKNKTPDSYINQFYEGVRLNLWETSHCEACFNFAIDSNGRIIGWELKNNTNKFMELRSILEHCTAKPGNLCDNCWQQYSELYEYYWQSYKTAIIAFGKSLIFNRFCADIENKMRETTARWRNVHKCKRPILPKKNNQIWSLVLVTIVLAVATVAFYVVSYRQGRRLDHQLRQYTKSNVVHNGLTETPSTAETSCSNSVSF